MRLWPSYRKAPLLRYKEAHKLKAKSSENILVFDYRDHNHNQYLMYLEAVKIVQVLKKYIRWLHFPGCTSLSSAKQNFTFFAPPSQNTPQILFWNLSVVFVFSSFYVYVYDIYTLYIFLSHSSFPFFSFSLFLSIWIQIFLILL